MRPFRILARCFITSARMSALISLDLSIDPSRVTASTPPRLNNFARFMAFSSSSTLSSPLWFVSTWKTMLSMSARDSFTPALLRVLSKSAGVMITSFPSLCACETFNFRIKSVERENEHSETGYLPAITWGTDKRKKKESHGLISPALELNSASRKRSSTRRRRKCRNRSSSRREAVK